MSLYEYMYVYRLYSCIFKLVKGLVSNLTLSEYYQLISNGLDNSLQGERPCLVRTLHKALAALLFIMENRSRLID